MRVLVIYAKDTGIIVMSKTLTDETEYSGGTIVTVPSGKILSKMNPETGEPIFVDAPTDQVTNLQNAIADHELRLLAGGL